VLAMVAANPCEPALEVAAVQELVDDFRDDGTQRAAARLIILGVSLLKRVIVAMGTLPEGRFLRISGAIDLHGSTGQHKDDLCHLTAQVHKTSLPRKCARDAKERKQL